jgi:hypothetical protein
VRHGKMKALLAELGDHFIGLWRFRVKGQRRLWCVTLHHNGYYYDTLGKSTPELALKDGIIVLAKAKRDTK